MYSDLNRPLNSALPRQQQKLADKLKKQDQYGVSEWMKDCMDALEAIGRNQFFQNVALKENYEIMEGRFILEHYLEREDYFDLASAVSQEFQLPHYLKHYDITSKAVHLLLGEFLKRPDNFRIIASDEDSTSEKVRVKTEMLQNYMQSSIQQEITRKLMSEGIDPNRNKFKDEQEQQQYQQMVQQKYQEFTPPAIEKYMRYDYRTSAEHWGQAVLNNDKHRFSLRELEKIEFTDMLVADRCYMHFMLTPDGYGMEVWNPLNTFFHQSPEVSHLEDGDYIGRTYYISKSKVIDIFGWRMTEDQQVALYPQYIKDKKQGDVYGEFFSASMYPFENYRDYSTIVSGVQSAMGFNPIDGSPLASIPTMNNQDFGIGGNYYFLQSDLVQVTEAYWRSQRLVGKLNYLNPETQKVEVHIVDETFDPKLFDIKEVDTTWRDSDEPNTISWCWTTQIWQGVKINQNHTKNAQKRDATGLYIDVRPAPFQFRGDILPFKSKLPVCGTVFNNRNGRSQSVVDLLKPYQIYYNALVNQSYGIVQRNNGKFFLMDVNILPSLKDWGGEESYEKFMSIAQTIGVGLVDTRPGHTQNAPFAANNSFQMVDMDETDKVTRLINLAMLVEQQGYLQLGISPQRQGQITQSAEVGTTQAAITNSYSITEHYFENYYNHKKRRLQMHLDIAQFVASREDDITLPYITDDLGAAWIKVTGTEVLLAQLGVNIQNSAEMAERIKMAQQLILQNNTTNIPMSALIGMLGMNNITDMQKSLAQFEADAQKQQQTQQEAEQKQQQEQIQAQKDMQKEEQDWKSNENELDRQNKIQIEQLRGIAAEGSFSETENLVPTLMDQAKIDLEQSKHSFDISLRQNELSLKRQESMRNHSLKKEDQSIKRDELDIKKEDLKTKKALEDKKLSVEKQKMANDLKIAKIKPKITPKKK